MITEQQAKDLALDVVSKRFWRIFCNGLGLGVCITLIAMEVCFWVGRKEIVGWFLDTALSSVHGRGLHCEGREG